MADQNNRSVMSPVPPPAQAAKPRDVDMPFLDHLEELRWRILKGLIGVLVGVVIAIIFSEWIMDFLLLGPTRKEFFMYRLLGIDSIDIVLQSRRLPGQFFTFWGTMLAIGAIAGSPVFFYQLWAFIEPALGDNAVRHTRMMAFSISFMFFLGICFGYLILTPFALQFFMQFTISDFVRNDFDINDYFGSLTTWILASGVIFQLPVITWALSRIGLLTPEFMIKYRRHSLVIILVLAAIITPPDPLSQILIAIPLVILYQFSILISRIAKRRRNKDIWGDPNGPKPE
jgi:sec-independent protein translocase protein TatC